MAGMAGVLAPRIGMSPTWMDVWPTNGFLIVFGIAAAAVGWRAPGFALSLPAALLINAVFFHVLPSIAARLGILMAQKRFRYADV
jgi:hypothetical protein